MAELKTKPTDADVSSFLERVDSEARRQECMELLEMLRDITGAEPKMWGTSIVGFGKYRYKYESGREGEWMVAGFSPRKNDLTVYVMPGLDRYAELLARLGKHKIGKSCLYIKRLNDVDRGALRELMTQAVADMAPQRVDNEAAGRQ